MSDCSFLISTNEKTWLPVNENYKQLNLEAQKAAQKSHYNVYKQLTYLRMNPVFDEDRHRSLLFLNVFLPLQGAVLISDIHISISVDIVSLVEEGGWYYYGLVCF
jgi:hypothetical protein